MGRSPAPPLPHSENSQAFLGMRQAIVHLQRGLLSRLQPPSITTASAGYFCHWQDDVPGLASPSLLGDSSRLSAGNSVEQFSQTLESKCFKETVECQLMAGGIAHHRKDPPEWGVVKKELHLVQTAHS